MPGRFGFHDPVFLCFVDPFLLGSLPDDVCNNGREVTSRVLPKTCLGVEVESDLELGTMLRDFINSSIDSEWLGLKQELVLI